MFEKKSQGKNILTVSLSGQELFFLNCLAIKFTQVIQMLSTVVFDIPNNQLIS